MINEQIYIDIPPEHIFYNFRQKECVIFLDTSDIQCNSNALSIISFEPFIKVIAKRKKVRVMDKNKIILEATADPFEYLKLLIQHYKPVYAIGYFGYDLGRVLENLPEKSVDDLNLPDMFFGFYNWALVYNHSLKSYYLIARNKKIADPIYKTISSQKYHDFISYKVHETHPVHSNFTKSLYIKAILKAKDYLRKGDIFQVNLSQRFCTKTAQPVCDIYMKLRRANPAPYSAFLRVDQRRAILSSSPELFLKVDGRRVITRPIKGTRPRGKSREDDEKLKRQLYNSSKDRAELAMIVDLERNDLGKICEVGSVKVMEAQKIETYATVHHLVATIEGVLPKKVSVVDLVKACFPGGSITGAPKIRAMEIIDELEPTQRNVYTGSIGYIDYKGDMQLNIAIRTILARDQWLYFQTGGGIVIDSDPQKEYQETLHKAEGIFRALGVDICNGLNKI